MKQIENVAAKKINTVPIIKPLEQEIYGEKGVYELVLTQKKSVANQEYKKHSINDQKIIENYSEQEIEQFFWKNLHLPSPVYGCDLKGSLFDDSISSSWDLRKLNSCLSDGLGKMNLEGITNPYLYFGSFRTMFAWHVEDLNLASINYQHSGKPKYWYGISRKVYLI